MMKVKFLIICLGFVLFVKANETRCFQFRWVAPVHDNEPDKYNCTKRKGIPCIEPLCHTEKPPNLNELWEQKNFTCLATSDNVCIKYTFTYNNHVVNTSYFCGKATQDEVIPITSGCFQQSVGGYVLEMCACEPRRGLPCNHASVKITCPVILIITMLLFTFISFS